MHLVIVPGVLDPQLFFSSEVLASGIEALVRPGSSVLDLGTGSGIGAIAAARSGATHVVATDIDPAAVRCARANIELNDVESIVSVRQGDLFAPVSTERFDLVCFNPPYLSRSGDGALDLALRAPADLAQRFASELADHLGPEGSGVVVLSTNGDPDAYLDPLAAAGFTAETITSRDRGSEILTAWRLRSA